MSWRDVLEMKWDRNVRLCDVENRYENLRRKYITLKDSAKLGAIESAVFEARGEFERRTTEAKGNG